MKLHHINKEITLKESQKGSTLHKVYLVNNDPSKILLAWEMTIVAHQYDLKY